MSTEHERIPAGELFRRGWWMGWGWLMVWLLWRALATWWAAVQAYSQ